MLSRSVAPEVLWYAVGAAVASYVGAVSWLCEKRGFGKIMLLLVALTSITAVFTQLGAEAERSPEQDQAYLDKYFSTPTGEALNSAAKMSEMERQNRRLGYSIGILTLIASISSGLLLGITLASMLLGHWYLNSPTMEMAPLRRLLIAMALAVSLQMAISLLGLWGEIAYSTSFSTLWISFVTIRWTFGLLGVAILIWMTWKTLDIPNTQSATGLLYVAVIGTFVGETMSLLLSTESLFPL